TCLPFDACHCSVDHNGETLDDMVSSHIAHNPLDFRCLQKVEDVHHLPMDGVIPFSRQKFLSGLVLLPLSTYFCHEVLDACPFYLVVDTRQYIQQFPFCVFIRCSPHQPNHELTIIGIQFVVQEHHVLM